MLRQRVPATLKRFSTTGAAADRPPPAFSHRSTSLRFPVSAMASKPLAPSPTTLQEERSRSTTASTLPSTPTCAPTPCCDVASACRRVLRPLPQPRFPSTRTLQQFGTTRPQAVELARAPRMECGPSSGRRAAGTAEAQARPWCAGRRCSPGCLLVVLLNALLEGGWAGSGAGHGAGETKDVRVGEGTEVGDQPRAPVVEAPSASCRPVRAWFRSILRPRSLLASARVGLRMDACRGFVPARPHLHRQHEFQPAFTGMSPTS